MEILLCQCPVNIANPTTTRNIPTTILANTGTGSSSTNSTPDKVLDNAPVTNAQAQSNQKETVKQIQAQGLATQIVTLKSQFGSLQKPIPTCNAPQIGQGGSMIEYAKCNKTKTQILDIQNRIKELGYKEDNGIAVKL